MPSFYEDAADSNSGTLAFMESNYPVSHLPGPLPSPCPTFPSPLRGFEKKVKEELHGGKYILKYLSCLFYVMGRSMQGRVLLGQQWSHFEMITSSQGHCVLS